MSALQQWESDWQMMFHPEKCTTTHISKKRNPIYTGYKLHGQTLFLNQFLIESRNKIICKLYEKETIFISAFNAENFM
jgi:hypothetical protein